MLGRLFAHHFVLPSPAESLPAGSLPGGGGVYALADEDERVIQLIGAESIRRSAARRLARDPAARGKRADLRAVARVLWWQPTWSPFETAWAYLNIARQLYPGDYHRRLAFGPAWFACLDGTVRCPRWAVSTRPFGDRVDAAGPFADRRHAARFVELLEDLFDLCRYPQVLEQHPHGRPCAYFDMGRCPAPCNATISLDQYAAVLAASAEFAAGREQARFAELEAQMTAAAARLEFERAQQLRDRVARARQTLAGAQRWAVNPADFRLLIVQRGPGAKLVRPYYVIDGTITPGKLVATGAIAEAAGGWRQQVRERASDKPCEADAIYRADCLALVAHFLAKGERAPGVFVHGTPFPDATTITQLVQRKFCRSRPVSGVQ